MALVFTSCKHRNASNDVEYLDVILILAAGRFCGLL
jgi:hypothetical protein